MLTCGTHIGQEVWIESHDVYLSSICVIHINQSPWKPWDFTDNGMIEQKYQLPREKFNAAALLCVKLWDKNDNLKWINNQAPGSWFCLA